MRILLTGGSGMLGRAIIRVAGMQFPGQDIIAPSRGELDLTDTSAVGAYIQSGAFDAVIHSAAVVGGIAANIAEPVRYLEENLAINNAVIMGAYRADVASFVFMGSSCMYPKDYMQPLKEEYLLAAPLEPTNEGYALSKITGAKLCEYICRDKGRYYKTLIPCNLYGVEDHFGSASSHLIAAATTKIVDAQRFGAATVDIWGTGEARREFLFVDDLAQFILERLPQLEALPAYLNIGYGHDHSVTEYYALLAEVAGYLGEFRYDPTQPEGMARKLMDSSKAQSLGWLAATSLKEGLARVVQAYRNQCGATA